MCEYCGDMYAYPDGWCGYEFLDSDAHTWNTIEEGPGYRKRRCNGCDEEIEEND